MTQSSRELSADSAASSQPENSDGIISEVLYGLNDRPPFLESLFVSLQHLLAIFIPIITPTLIIARELGLDPSTTAYLVNMALFASGISTFIQVRKVGPVGSGLLSIQGTSFSFLGAIIAAGKAGGLPLIFGICMAGSVIEMVLSRFISIASKIITPLVTGIVVTMIGLSLIKVGVSSCAGGVAAKASGTFGSPLNLGVAALVILVIVVLNGSSRPLLRMSSILFGFIAGVAAWGYLHGFGGAVVASVAAGASAGAGVSPGAGGILSWLAIPVPLKFGISFELAAFIPVALVYLITTIETIGDLTATSINSNEPITGEIYVKRISGGVLGDGFNSLLAGVFNSFPNTTFSQNNGVIKLTGVASRHVGYFVAALLMIIGLFPAVGELFSKVPQPVLGGATLILFGTIAATGIGIISTARLNRRAIMIMALSFAAGLGVEMVPDVLAYFPKLLRGIFSSGITAGGLTALVANVLLRH
jgi:xanthine permease XanP